LPHRDRLADCAQVKTPWATKAAVILGRSAHTANGGFPVCRDDPLKWLLVEGPSLPKLTQAAK
jgi:hypothetical protein